MKERGMWKNEKEGNGKNENRGHHLDLHFQTFSILRYPYKIRILSMYGEG